MPSSSAAARGLPEPDLPVVWSPAAPEIERDGSALTPSTIDALCRELRRARKGGLAHMPVAAIVAAIARAVSSWGVRGDARRETAARLAAVTGYHPAMVELAFDDLARAFNLPQLHHLLERELGDPRVLDGFVAREDGRVHRGEPLPSPDIAAGQSSVITPSHTQQPTPNTHLQRAFGPDLIATVLSGNVPHVAAESMILALLAKSACLVKASSRDPLFPLLFARSLAAADARLGAGLAVVRWPGGDSALERATFRAVDAVVAYGSAGAVASVRAATPDSVRVIAHGPKISFAVVTAGRDHRREADARAAGHDVSFLDQQGCVSPHTIFVEGDAAAALGFARRLADAMADIAATTPRGPLDAPAAAAIHQARGAAEFRPGAEVLIDPAGTGWTVIFDPRPAFAPSCLNRVAHVRPLPRLADLPYLLAPVQPFLQTCGVAGDEAALLAVAEIVAPLGVARVCPLGRMQHPPAGWRHDGRPRLLDLLRWTDVERAQA